MGVGARAGRILGVGATAGRILRVLARTGSRAGHVRTCRCSASRSVVSLLTWASCPAAAALAERSRSAERASPSCSTLRCAAACHAGSRGVTWGRAGSRGVTR
eukprot:7096-Prymnesium_polylepis.1